MYIDIERTMGVLWLLVQGYTLMAIPSGLLILWLTLKGKRIGRVDPDADTQTLVLKGMVTWPKVYFLLAFGFITNLVRTKTPDEESADAFALLFQRRLHENENLESLIDDVNGEGISLRVRKLAGETYMVLHEHPEFLLSIQRSDGSYDEESMERLESLDDWMVMDLIDAHPQYKEILPPEITQRNKLH